ncbi:MAG: hypothetical protein M3R17_20130, partial [Bacteroidota bacterium]|nr:hypothetical protein [Bacteroidota bacterium]
MNPGLLRPVDRCGIISCKISPPFTYVESVIFARRNPSLLTNAACPSIRLSNTAFPGNMLSSNLFVGNSFTSQ